MLGTSSPLGQYHPPGPPHWLAMLRTLRVGKSALRRQRAFVHTLLQWYKSDVARFKLAGSSACTLPLTPGTSESRSIHFVVHRQNLNILPLGPGPGPPAGGHRLRVRALGQGPRRARPLLVPLRLVLHPTAHPQPRSHRPPAPRPLIFFVALTALPLSGTKDDSGRLGGTPALRWTSCKQRLTQRTRRSAICR
jgi:hypothetical protein